MPKLILIVDDEPRNLRLEKDLLEVCGYNVIEATNGEQGVQQAKDNIPDLIVMDVQMPVMDGIEAMKLLKDDETTKAIPVIILSSYAMKGDRERFLEQGCDEYMAKPIDIKQFQEMVAAQLSE